MVSSKMSNSTDGYNMRNRNLSSKHAQVQGMKGGPLIIASNGLDINNSTHSSSDEEEEATSQTAEPPQNYNTGYFTKPSSYTTRGIY